MGQPQARSLAGPPRAMSVEQLSAQPPVPRRVPWSAMLLRKTAREAMGQYRQVVIHLRAVAVSPESTAVLTPDARMI
jgi:hypothetical protein